MKGTLTQSSDLRLKRDIRPIERAMEKIMALRPVVYKWRKWHIDDHGKDHIGLMAQDVQKVVPEVVFHQGKYLSVAYSKLVPLLIEGIKEQDKEIETLSDEIDALLKEKGR